MLRFPKNRWALILLAFFAFSVLSGLRAVRAEVDPVGYTPPDQQGGDPDVPDGKNPNVAKNGVPVKRWVLEEHRVGDMAATRTDGVWRLIMILKGLRLFVFRF
jgi:hypothetical protein